MGSIGVFSLYLVSLVRLQYVALLGPKGMYAVQLANTSIYVFVLHNYSDSCQ